MNSPYTRDQLRQSYVDAWHKHRSGRPLTPLEALIVDIIALHPEYHSRIDTPADALEFSHDAAAAGENPFLHMGLHIAIREQLAIDRPPGVCELHRQLCARRADTHEADHALMEALAETLWEAQRASHPPDTDRYLERARRRLTQG